MILFSLARNLERHVTLDAALPEQRIFLLDKARGFRDRGVTDVGNDDGEIKRSNAVSEERTRSGDDYDANGRPKSTTQGTNVISRTYDGLGRVKTVTHNGRTLSYDYDIAGRRTQLTWPDGFQVSYDYEDDGALSAINDVDTGAMLVSYAYDGLGRTTDLFRGNGVSTAVAYDTASRVNNIDHIGLNATTFSWNPAGQIAGRNVTNTSWNHAMPTDGMVDDYTPNTLNQYTEIENNPVQHDLNGNLVSYKTGTYTYNVHNRMTRAEIGSTNIILTYDPDGRLSKSVVDGTATEFLYDGDELIAEYDNDGNLLRRYIHGAGVDDPQVVIEANGAKRWLHADERGSIVAETGASGNLLVTHTYDPYGNPGNTSTSRFRYTGQILIPGTEANALYYYKARVYHPRIGRFMQTDPLGYKDGMNWYAYVGNDPMNRKDPEGTSCTLNDGGTPSCKLDDRGGLSSGEVKRFERNYTNAVKALLKDPDKKVTITVNNDSFEVTAGDQAKALMSATVMAEDPSDGNRASTEGGTLNPISSSGEPEVRLGRSVFREGDSRMKRSIVHESIHLNPGEEVMREQWKDSPKQFNIDHQGPYNRAAEELLYR